MKDKFFLDTNILVYSFDQKSQKKREKAQALVRDAFRTQKGVISYQVVQEFTNVASKAASPLELRDLRTYLDEVLLPLCEFYPGSSFFKQALGVHFETKYSYYDSLIITAALSTDCKFLLTEDMQHGQAFRGLQIMNPFEI